ncbi:MAG: response regulator, partial [Bacilli bacterium]|nr:response regulator [Bacilli bacterium]
MIRYLKQVWADLGRSIFVGERREKNMLGIAIGAALIVVVNLITGTIKLINKSYMDAISSLVLIIFFSVVFLFIVVWKKRKVALTFAVIGAILIYSYDVIFVDNPLMPIWTILFPWAFSYLVSVKVGMLLSGYFSTFYLVLFYTPLNQFVEEKYSAIIEQFPIVYLANAFLCIFIMVQYHRNTLNQMDYSKQLTEAKAAAEHANTAKSEFLASMSHEIRTPINAVLGMNEMILRESLQARDKASKENPELRGYLTNISNYAGNIDSAGKNLLAIINDILDFSKIESGKMEITEADYKFSSVLNDISNIVSFKAKDKGLFFRIEVDKDLPDGLFGDELRVRQIMTNLLGNAVKYTKEGGVVLSVGKDKESEVKEGEPLNLIIAVKDTGIGIRPEDIEKLFQKFERVDLQQNSTVEGSGLGLAITKNLLELMHGSVKVESVYGEGSTFTVTLPQKVVSTEAVGDFKTKFEKSVQEAKQYRESFRAPDAHILIVDDTRMNLLVAVGLLKKTQMEIDTAASGLEAIQLAKTIHYDLILMDQRMPGMDGTETMKNIKALENNPNADTPFICLTADAVSGARSHYLAEGFTDYLTKPIDSKALERTLIKYLPEKKIHIVSQDGEEAAETEEAPKEGDEFATLRSIGVDPDVGLRFCQNDLDLYRSILLDYAQSSDGKIENISEYFTKEDWKNYAICVHALKSTSKTIGAAALSERALRLETAGNEADSATIHAEHEKLLAQYRE